MPNLELQLPADNQEIHNVTTRKVPNLKQGKMASDNLKKLDLGSDSSLFIDSILSQDETNDILSMMVMADEHKSGNRLPSFCTSSQMGGRDQRRRPVSPPLSPLRSSGWGSRCDDAWIQEMITSPPPNNNANLSKDSKDLLLNKRNTAVGKKAFQDGNREGTVATDTNELLDREDSKNRFNATTAVRGLRQIDDGNEGDWNERDAVAKAKNLDTEDVTSPKGGKQSKDGSSTDEEDSVAGDPGEKGEEGEELKADDDLTSVAAKLKKVDEMLAHLDDKSSKLGVTVKDLITSLEFSQAELMN